MLERKHNCAIHATAIPTRLGADWPGTEWSLLSMTMQSVNGLTCLHNHFTVGIKFAGCKTSGSGVGFAEGSMKWALSLVSVTILSPTASKQLF